jgi:cold shock CspA family protein|tara:strand:- start:24 stop:356 length:333 start_codon:yes stop_codon:yes gene_type:complete
MSSQSVTTNNSKNIGRVKWFNNKSGYGFITFMNNEQYKGNDIFVHHSAIVSKQNLYKYLVQGEYVEFNIDKMANKEHEIQATNITGILEGMLMCETRFLNKENMKLKDNN